MIVFAIEVMTHDTFPAYRLPSVDVLRLVPQIPKETLSSFRKNPNVVHRQLNGKVLLFRKGDIKSDNKPFSIQCEIEVGGGKNERYIAVFTCLDLLCPANVTSNVILPCPVAGDDSTDLFGVVIGSSTQIIFSSCADKCSLCSPYPGSLMLFPSHISSRHEKMTFELQPEEVQSALIGCASSVFGSESSSTSSSGQSTFSNVLLVAPSGSGSTTVSQHLSTLFNASLTIITYTSIVARYLLLFACVSCINVAISVRRGKEYADQTLHDILQCALVQRPVVIVLDDLTAIAPREVKSDEQNQARVVQVSLSIH